jgi:hypothetical protein
MVSGFSSYFTVQQYLSMYQIKNYKYSSSYMQLVF